MKHGAVQLGQRVWWTDPDHNTCSGPGIVISIGGFIVAVKKDDGGEVEAFAAELTPWPYGPKETP